jgi:hypothetical protein
MVAGSQLAHVLAYRIVYPQAQIRLRDLLSTGHGYMVGGSGWITLALGVLGALELLGLAWTLVTAVASRRSQPVPAWAFALLPLLGFALQEFLERWLSGGSFPWWFVLQPTFRIGLLLQVPFGIAVFLVARLLLRVTERIAAKLGEVRVRPLAVGAFARWSVVEAVLRAWLLPAAHSGRGPPAVPSGTAFA